MSRVGVRSLGPLLLAVSLLPGSGLACPCVDTVVVGVVEKEQRLIATVSETSQVMLTAALYELLTEEILPSYADWAGHWRVSFYTSAAGASHEDGGSPAAHVADYDRANRKLTLWPRIAERRQEIDLEIR